MFRFYTPWKHQKNQGLPVPDSKKFELCKLNQFFSILCSMYKPFSCRHYIKIPLPKVSLLKTIGHTTSAFQKYRLENKLLLKEFGAEMDIIISNTVQSKSVLLWNSSGRSSINRKFLPTLYGTPLLLIIYIDIKQWNRHWILDCSKSSQVTT